MAPVRTKRVYDPPQPADGKRILVDRLWPRGLTRAKAGVDLWLKALSPSHVLRKRVHGDPRDWEAFVIDYAAELEQETARSALAELQDLVRQGTVTLLYAGRDTERNNAVALKAWLETRRE